MSTTLEILHTGGVIVDRTLPYHRPEDPPLSWAHVLRGRGDLVTAPVSAYLIENSRGLTLIDTGWHPVNRRRLGQIANLRHQYPVNKAELPDGRAIDEQLEERGIRPRDLDLVLMSHLHCDHADGLRLVREAPRILVSRPEAEGVRLHRATYLPHEWNGVDLQTFCWNTRVGPYGAGYDVFGDGSLVMVAVPGHSRGLCATVVRGRQVDDTAMRAPDLVEGLDAADGASGALGSADPRAFYLLASDVGYGRPSFDEGLRPSVVVDASQAERSLAWARRVEHDPRCLGLIANHDPEIEAGTRAL